MIGPFGGALADRLDRRRLLTIGQSINMVLSFVLAVLTASGLMTVPLLVLIIGLNGAVIGINQPARLALISALVTREHLPTAVAINSLVFNLARFIGPAIAGLVILHFSIALVFLLNALSFISFLARLHRLDLPEIDREPAKGGRPSMLQAIGEGFRYVLGHPGIGPLLGLNATLAITARPYVELLPGFAGAVFDRGAGGLAMLSSAVGLGAIAAGLFLAQRGPRKGLAETAMLAALLIALSALALALSPTFWVALIAVTSGGFGMVVAGVGTQTLMQTSVDEAVRGRVLSLFGLGLQKRTRHRRADHGAGLRAGRPALASGRRLADRRARLCLCLAEARDDWPRAQTGQGVSAGQGQPRYFSSGRVESLVQATIEPS